VEAVESRRIRPDAPYNSRILAQGKDIPQKNRHIFTGNWPGWGIGLISRPDMRWGGGRRRTSFRILNQASTAAAATEARAAEALARGSIRGALLCPPSRGGVYLPTSANSKQPAALLVLHGESGVVSRNHFL